MNNINSIGNEHRIIVCATMVTKPIAMYDIYDMNEPWLIYEWGTDYNGRYMKMAQRTWRELYTKSNFTFYKFTRRDIWGCRRVTA